MGEEGEGMTSAELRAAMSALPEPITDLKPPHWEYWRWELWKHVVNSDDPALFWEWPCVYHTMLQNHWPHVVEFEAYEMVKNTAKYPVSVQSPKNGPFDYLVNGLENSRNLIHQAYHIWNWQNVTGKQISDLSTIVEFGAGYGALALLVYRLGFKGTYYVVDLPEFSLLQQYYLSNTGEKVNVKWGLPLLGVDQKTLTPKTFDFLIALYSLSEIPYSERDSWLYTIPADNHLFLYSNRFENFDNVNYFVDTYAPRVGGRWNHWKIEHMPPESWYSIGRKA